MAVHESVPFTSRQEIEELLSQLGVTLRLDDDITALVARFVSMGTSDVRFYLHKAGAAADLALVPWVRDLATIAAARRLTGFAGEPMSETLQTWWDEAREQLTMILDKEATVPGLDDVQAPQMGGAPVVVNRMINPAFLPSSRVIRPASTDTPEAVPQPTAYVWPGPPWSGWW